MKIRIQDEKIVETDMHVWYYTYKKQLLESGRNSECKQPHELFVIGF